MAGPKKTSTTPVAEEANAVYAMAKPAAYAGSKSSDKTEKVSNGMAAAHGCPKKAKGSGSKTYEVYKEVIAQT